MFRWSFRVVLALVLFLPVIAASVPAQQLAAVRITVTDPKGGFVAGATKNPKKGKNGVQRFPTPRGKRHPFAPDVPPGNFDPPCKHPPFSPPPHQNPLTTIQLA